MEFFKPEKLWLKDHPEFNEKWVQKRIADDPSILGLGDLILKDKERIQPRTGRLDLLLQDADTDRRYEVELQLGRTDETHIIRTIEYWDIERNRYPQYDHCAVLVAEDITSRFLNVIRLFNSSVPLIAIQMMALKVEQRVALVFSTVVDEFSRGLVDEDEEVQEAADRPYWESRATKDILGMVDQLLDVLKESDPTLEPKYNKFYIGLARGGVPDNFVSFEPRKTFLRLDVRLARSDDTDNVLKEAGVDLMEYDRKWGKYRLRVSKQDLAKQKQVLTSLFKTAYEASIS